MSTTRTLETAVAYFDTTPGNVGWAFRLHFDDDSQESGELTTTGRDDGAGATRELRSMVSAYGGEWSRPEYVDEAGHFGGGFRWTA